MIVIVLIIILQLVESTAAVAMKAKLEPEYLAMKEKIAALEKRKNALQEGVTGEERVLSEKSEEDLKKILEHEKQYADMLKKQFRDLSKKQTSLLAKSESLKEEIEQTKMAAAELKKNEKEIQEMQSRCQELAEQNENCKAQIEAKKKKLQFEFEGTNDKIPLLIECNSWGFRCKKHPDGAVTFIGKENGFSSCKDLIPELSRWCRKHNLDRCYPVFLFKESSLPFYDDIIGMTLTWNITIGKEPVASDAECF